MDIEQEHLAEFLIGKWVPLKKGTNYQYDNISICFEADGGYKYEYWSQVGFDDQGVLTDEVIRTGHYEFWQGEITITVTHIVVSQDGGRRSLDDKQDVDITIILPLTDNKFWFKGMEWVKEY